MDRKTHGKLLVLTCLDEWVEGMEAYIGHRRDAIIAELEDCNSDKVPRLQGRLKELRELEGLRRKLEDNPPQ